MRFLLPLEAYAKSRILIGPAAQSTTDSSRDANTSDSWQLADCDTLSPLPQKQHREEIHKAYTIYFFAILSMTKTMPFGHLILRSETPEKSHIFSPQSSRGFWTFSKPLASNVSHSDKKSLDL
jgi:hypothetical protein